VTRVRELETDVAVVGSGPGGATVARRLAAAGRRVVVLEKGRADRRLGSYLGALRYVDRGGLLFTEEGLNVVRAITTGGCTVIYCGTATEPPAWLRERYGLDLEPFAQETIAELKLEPLPDEACGEPALRLLAAANELGYHWTKLRKFIDPARCRLTCGGTCMLGCRHGAKWTAREYLDEAVGHGAELVTRADVLRVRHEDGVATGVTAAVPDGLLEVRARTVVVAAGGLGTPVVLQRSGLDEAGVGMFLDPLVMVAGVSRERGTWYGPPMSVGTYEMVADGVLLSNLIDPFALHVLMTGRAAPERLLQTLRFRDTLGIMVKIGDERRGVISVAGRISKPLGERDRRRLNKGVAVAQAILLRAGCDPRTLVVGPVRGAHPGGTARIGEVVDRDLQTRVRNLYVCDASVIPEALDLPTVLTVISLGKRLAAHLLGAGAGGGAAATA
jgi:choline dehydrogenase-like flavoprotein